MHSILMFILALVSLPVFLVLAIIFFAAVVMFVPSLLYGCLGVPSDAWCAWRSGHCNAKKMISRAFLGIAIPIIDVAVTAAAFTAFMLLRKVFY